MTYTGGSMNLCIHININTPAHRYTYTHTPHMHQTEIIMERNYSVIVSDK